VTAPQLATGTAAETAIIAQYNAAQSQLTRTLAAFIARLWAGFRTYGNSDGKRFAGAAVPAAQGAQRAMSSLTAAYLSQLMAAMTGDPVRPAAPPSAGVTGEALRGVDPFEVYQRPITQARVEIARGKTVEQAHAAGLRRAQSIAATDLQLAKTHTSRAVIQHDGRVVGYRRVLTGAENCGLCVVASTLRYHVKDLMPIHPGCDCAVSVIVGHRDPGTVINSAQIADGAEASGTTKGGVKVYQPGDTLDLGDLLEPVHAAIEDRFGASYRDARQVDYRKVITVHRHGELGPVLSVSSQHFTGEHDLPLGAKGEARRAATVPSAPNTREVARHQLGVLEDNLPKLEARAAAGEDVSKPLAYHRAQIEVLRKRAEGG
jgi:hypothetical protein